MSQIVADFDPSSAKSGQFSPLFPNGQGRIVVWNKSNIDLTFSWPGCIAAFIPAWQARLLYVKSGNAQITWAQLLILPGQTPDSTVIVESYADSEIIAESYPASLNRSLATANTIVPVPGATFLFAPNLKAGGAVNVKLAHDPNGVMLTYLQGFTFTTTVFAALTSVDITIAGLAENGGSSDTPTYFVEGSTTNGAFLDIRFPSALPATNASTDIIIQSSNYPAGVTGCLIAYAYQQAPN